MEDASSGRLLLAVGLNLLLTVVELVGGILSGSLALLADALHNFGDCGSLLVALIARRWSRKRADRQRTFGYARAEVVGAVINLTALILIAFYLVIEAIQRVLSPQEIHGPLVIAIAAVALAVDVGTVLLLWAARGSSVNLRAAVLHNLSDALASVGVIAVGVVVILWPVYAAAADILVSLVIAGYILWQSIGMLKSSIAVLMNSAPLHIDIDEMVQELTEIPGVRDVHHVHLWQLDEQRTSLEAHVVIDRDDVESMEQIKDTAKRRLAASFGIEHSTLEFELHGKAACEEPGGVIADH